MLENLYDYTHPILYINPVETRGCRKAKRVVGSSRDPKGWRRVRRAVKCYLRHGSKPRIKQRAAGDSWNID